VKMFSDLLGNEEINAATALVLSGTLIALMAKGTGPVSSKRIVSRVLSNPVSGSPALEARVVPAHPFRTKQRARV